MAPTSRDFVAAEMATDLAIADIVGGDTMATLCMAVVLDRMPKEASRGVRIHRLHQRPCLPFLRRIQEKRFHSSEPTSTPN